MGRLTAEVRSDWCILVAVPTRLSLNLNILQICPQHCLPYPLVSLSHPACRTLSLDLTAAGGLCVDRCICDVQPRVDPQCCPRPLAWPYLAPLPRTAPAAGVSRCERGKGDRGEGIRPVRVTNRLHIPQKSTGSSPPHHLGDDHICHFAGLATCLQSHFETTPFIP